jgi:hypothetical protein
MIKHLKPVRSALGIKRLMLIIAFSGMMLMPEDLVHFFAVVIHTVYESIAYALEEVLIHGVGFSKFHAQMIVFYTSVVIGILAAIAFFRRVPQWFARGKIWAIQRYTQVSADISNNWRIFYHQRKLELMLLQFAGIVSLMAFALI